VDLVVIQDELMGFDPLGASENLPVRRRHPGCLERQTIGGLALARVLMAPGECRRPERPPPEGMPAGCR
jgi:hypothetical protein